MMKFPEKVNMNVLYDYYRKPLEKIINSPAEQINLSDFSINILGNFEIKILREENKTLE